MVPQDSADWGAALVAALQSRLEGFSIFPDGSSVIEAVVTIEGDHIRIQVPPSSGSGYPRRALDFRFPAIPDYEGDNPSSWATVVWANFSEWVIEEERRA